MEVQQSSLWISCPSCQRKTSIKVYEDTMLIHFPLYCRWCRKEYMINLINQKVDRDKERQESFACHGPSHDT